MQTKNLLKIDANKQVKLSNIAALILNYDLAGKSVEKVNSNYKYIYKIFAKFETISHLKTKIYYFASKNRNLVRFGSF